MIIHSEVVPSEIASESASEIAPESVSFCPALHFYCFCQKVDYLILRLDYLILRYVIWNRILCPWSYVHKSDDKCFVWEVFQVVKLGFPLFHSYISLPTPLVSCVDVSVCLIFFVCPFCLFFFFFSPCNTEDTISYWKYTFFLREAHILWILISEAFKIGRFINTDAPSLKVSDSKLIWFDLRQSFNNERKA